MYLSRFVKSRKFTTLSQSLNEFTNSAFAAVISSYANAGAADIAIAAVVRTAVRDAIVRFNDFIRITPFC